MVQDPSIQELQSALQAMSNRVCVTGKFMLHRGIKDSMIHLHNMNTLRHSEVKWLVECHYHCLYLAAVWWLNISRVGRRNH
jgi:hypothetical protein